MKNIAFILVFGCFVNAHANAPEWTQFKLVASKFMMTTESTISVKEVFSSVVPLINSTQGTAIQPSNRITQITFDSAGLGQKSHRVLSLDSATGAALQMNILDGGSKKRKRIYRYTSDGTYSLTDRPNKNEENLPLQQWTNHYDGYSKFSENSKGLIITDPGSLFLILANSQIEKPGQFLEFYAEDGGDIYKIHVEVASSQKVNVNYLMKTSRGNFTQQHTVTDGIRVLISGASISSPSAKSFELLGLHGALEMIIDRQSRAPLQLRGDIDVVGSVTANISELVFF